MFSRGSAVGRLLTMGGLSAIGIGVFVSTARAVEPPNPTISSPSPGVVSIALGRAYGKVAIAVRHDGSILVAAAAASSDRQRVTLSLLGLASDGGLVTHETGDNGDGSLRSVDISDVTITPEGRIVVVGAAHESGAGDRQSFLVARFLPDGKPDVGFAEKGWLLTDVGKRHDHNMARSVAVQLDGKIVTAGISLVPYWAIGTAYSFSAVRYNTDGSLDTNFGDGGRVITRMGASREDDASAALILRDGKIIVAGTADTYQNMDCGAGSLNCFGFAGSPDFALARYLPNGQLDRSVGQSGRTRPIGQHREGSVAAQAAALDTQDRIVAAGSANLSYRAVGKSASLAPVFARYDAAGNLDNTFGKDGVAELEPSGAIAGIYAIAVQSDDKIIAVGRLRVGKCGACSGAIRLSPNGSLDKGFANSGVFALPFEQNRLEGHSIAVQEDGKLMLWGERAATIVLIRLNSDGKPDTTFGATRAP
jgi:uncharacterized delta-60 repeat protein